MQQPQRSVVRRGRGDAEMQRGMMDGDQRGADDALLPQPAADMGAEVGDGVGSAAQAALQPHLAGEAVSGVCVRVMHHDDRPPARAVHGGRHHEIERTRHRTDRDIGGEAADLCGQAAQREGGGEEPDGEAAESIIGVHGQVASRRGCPGQNFGLAGKR